MSERTTHDPVGRIAPDPHEQALLQELRAAWNIGPDDRLRVVGSLNLRRREGDRSVVFLESLEHPVTGARLAFPKSATPASAYVPVSEVERLSDPETTLATNHLAIAELRLSWIEVRERSGNPYHCRVEPHTLQLLSEVPELWNIPIFGPESARKVTMAARLAIDEQIEQEYARLDEELARAEAYRDNMERELESVRGAIRSGRDRLDALDVRVLRQTQETEDRFRHLRELLAEKRDRLVALDLIDADDLEISLPQAGARDVLPAPGFHDALDGDFARLAPALQTRLRERGMLFSQALLRDFLALLRTHDLVILAGDSGSGKTSLVRGVADAIGGVCEVIPVKPNWTGPEDLLGYYNPMERRYLPTPFLKALQAAAAAPDVPHFVLLDEMNLARVEYYLADFLSRLEERGGSPQIELYTSDEERHTVVESSLFLAIEAEVRARSGLAEGTTFKDLLKNDRANQLLRQLGGFQEGDPVLVHHARLRRALAALLRTPTSIRFPSNVRIIGAVNVDETTHYLSPKVLDRAHVLRFRNPVLVDWAGLDDAVEAADPGVSLAMRLSAQDLGVRDDYPPFDPTDAGTAWLVGMARQLDLLGVEFGFRAIRQAVNYVQHAQIAGVGMQAARNNVVLHKVLPKLTLVDMGQTGGDGRTKREILVALREELREHMAGLDLRTVTESCVTALDRLIASAEGNNGVANYWLR